MRLFQKYWALFVAFAAILIASIVNKNTFDSGDSIQHYLIAKYSFANPELFLDHWGKPIFTLLASSFTQLGWNGMIIFNGLVGFLTCFFLYKSARLYNITYAWLSIFLLLLVASYLLSLQSGLTEPLFGLFLMASFYFASQKKYLVAALLISFLPFIRSEGYIVMIVYAAYFLLNKNFIALSLLASGTIIYSIAGSFHHHTITWLFTQNPYNTGGNNYGSGPWDHYFIQFYFTGGLMYTIFFIIGLTALPLLIKREWANIFKKSSQLEEVFLIYGVFAAYFFSHVIFWTFGLYNSFGMTRVMIAIIPIGTFIALRGFNVLAYYLSKKHKPILVAVVLILIILIPFSGNKTGFNINKDFSKLEDQMYADKVINEIKDKNIICNKYSFAFPYLSMKLNINPYDSNVFVSLGDLENGKIKAPVLFLWDSHFFPYDQNVNKDVIYQMPYTVNEIKINTPSLGPFQIIPFVLK